MEIAYLKKDTIKLEVYMVHSYNYGNTKSFVLHNIQKEVVRKAIHLLVAFVPTLAVWNFDLTVFLLISGILVYTYAEYLRIRGRYVPLISDLTAIASRDRDRGHFVLGPVTLGLGALLALLLYPHPAATIAIYALAFGDGLSSLAGKLFGVRKIPFTDGKTYAGSFTCFLAVFMIVRFLSGDLIYSLSIALASTILEAIPSKDLDNMIIPIGTGLLASLL